MILLDTSALIESLTGPARAAPRLRALIDEGHRLAVCAPVLYEWWRGPRLPRELEVQERLLPSVDAIPFGVTEARIAASIYAQLQRGRGREVDIAIAACALACDAMLWTMNGADFDGIPGLRVISGVR